MAINDWMSGLDDNLRLCDIVMPGSHDAGMWETHGIGRDGHVVTHDKDITQQLDAGCRFFDFRIFNYNTFGTTKASDLYFGHFAETTGRGNSALGRFGAKVVPALNAINTWIAGTREIVFLRFSHINSSNRPVVVQAVKNTLDGVLFKRPSNTPSNLAYKKLGDLKGHVVAIFDIGDGFVREKDNGILVYRSHKKVNQIPRDRNIDLQLCGEYSNKSNLAEMEPLQRARHAEHQAHVLRVHDTKHLHVIYFTFTSGVKNIKDMTAQYDGNLPAFLNTYVTKKTIGNEAIGNGCNIVMMDFINADKCKLVVNLGNGLNIP
jgi:hypothetical protein